jgi:gliding motility-associated-like protein
MVWTFHIVDYRPPVVANDFNSTTENLSVDESDGSGNLLANDSDPEGTALTVSAINGDISGTVAGTYGTLEWNADGTYTYTPNPAIDSLAAGEVVTEFFTETIRNGYWQTSSSTLTITITGENDIPIAVNDFNATIEYSQIDQTSGSGNLLANDTDPDGDLLIVASINGNITGSLYGAYGRLLWNPDGTYHYVPNSTLDSLTEGEVVIEIFNELISDGHDGGTANSTLSITITGENDLPVASDDFNSTVETTPVNQSNGSGNLLANDYDPEGDLLTITTINGNVTDTVSGIYGTLVWTSNGNYTYTPNPEMDSLSLNENVVDIFSERVSDGKGETYSTLRITIYGATLNRPPVARADYITVPEDTTNCLINVLSNDFDPDGDPLTVSIVSGPVSGGTAVVVTGNFVNYNPPLNFNGNDYFIYRICDNGIPSLCDIDTVFITVTPVNDPPVANTDIVVILVNTSTIIDVQANDYDVDGDALTTTFVSVPTSGGTAEVINGNTVSYIPPTDFEGTDTIIYQICDDGEPILCDIDTVFIHVIHQLIAIDDVFDVYAGQTDTLNILRNDLYVGNINVTIIDNPVHGTAVLNPDGTVRYTAAADYIGNDQLIYVISDGFASDTAVVFIRIHPFIIENTQSACNGEKTQLEWNINVIGVTVSSVNIRILDLNGTLVEFFSDTTLVGSIPWPGLSVDGLGYIILPPNNLRTLRVQASYNVEPFNEIKVSTVDFHDCHTNVVVAIHDTATITKPVQLIRVLDNDYDPDEGEIDPSSLDTVKYKDFAGPYHGNVNINKDGTITFIPEIRYTGLDSFVYIICDDIHPAACDTAIVRLKIIWDYKLVAGDDYYWTYKDQAKTFDVSRNDLDPDGTLDLTSVKVLDNPRHGSFVIQTDGKIKYTPDNGFVGRDSFYYEICNTDITPDCDQAWVTVDVIENRQIIANRDDVTTGEGEGVNISILHNDYDPEGLIDTTSITITEIPDHGTVDILNDGTVDYIPDNGFAGLDSFIYRLCDSGVPVTCDTAIVYINVTKNGQLIANRDDVTTGAEENIIIPVLENDFDPEGLIDTTSLSITDIPEHGTAHIKANGTIDYVPNDGFAGLDSFIYRLCDSGFPVTCDTAIVYIHVTDNNIAIVANPDKGITPVNEPLVISVLDNDYDPDGIIDTLSLAITEQPSNGIVTVQPDGTISYHPNNGFIGRDSLIYMICDNGPVITCDTAIVKISVVNNLPPVLVNDTNSTTDTLAVNETHGSGNLLNNDSDPEGNILTITGISGDITGTVTGTYGTLRWNSDGTYVYTPDSELDSLAEGEIVTEIFNETVSDGNGGTAHSTLTITITGENDLPVLSNDTNSTVETTPVNELNGSGNLLANDYDPDGDILTIAEINGNISGTVSGIYGTLDWNSNGTYIYTPNPEMDSLSLNESVVDLFYETVVDGKGGSAISTLIITINGVSIPLSAAVDDYLTIWIDEIVNIPVLDNDSTQMNDSTLIIIQNPIHGYTTINNDFTITYSSESGYVGTDSFQYEVCDNYDFCDTATVFILIENLKFPELFSPNGDGVNDYYVIGGIEKYPNNRFLVFNRWGNKVYDKVGYLNNWDGWANVKFVIGSKELPVGVYYYILRYNDISKKVGALFLER